MRFYERHHLSRLFHTNDVGRNLVPERNSCRTAFYHQGIAEFFSRFRLVDDNKLPGLRVASAGRKASCLYQLHKILSRNRAVSISPAAFSLFKHFLKCHLVVLLYLNDRKSYYSRNRNLTCQDLFIVLIVFAQKYRNIQLIGTFLHALAAVDAGLDLFHVGLPLLGEPVL